MTDNKTESSMGLGEQGIHPFPGSEANRYETEFGMTYHQWLVGQALPGIDHSEINADDAARWAIEVADEVVRQLEERKAGK